MRCTMSEINEAAELLTPTASKLADPRGGLDARGGGTPVASNADSVRLPKPVFKP